MVPKDSKKPKMSHEKQKAMLDARVCHLHDSRANSYHWSPFPPRRARPGPGPHRVRHHGRFSLADCTPPPLPQQLFVLEGLAGGGGLDGGEGALPPFTHKPNCTVLPTVHRARLFSEAGNCGAETMPDAWVCHHLAVCVRTGSWTGPPRGERAPRVRISSTVFGVRTLNP